MDCRWCEQGDKPTVLDIDGVLSSLSGKPGCWGHAHEDNWWPCQRKAAEEHAIVEAAWKLRTEAKDYNPCPDLGLRAMFRDDLHRLLDQWKAANAAGG